MNHFRVNGVDTHTPVAESETLASLIQYVRAHLPNDNAMISSIRVDGTDFFSLEEVQSKEMSLRTLESMSSIDVILSHPREMAEETLQTLKLYVEQLAALSIRIAAEESYARISVHAEYPKLLDGIDAVIQSVSGVKNLLKHNDYPEVKRLESELLAILQEVLECQKRKDTIRREQLLSKLLPQNLIEWRDVGIPSIIRFHDC